MKFCTRLRFVHVDSGNAGDEPTEGSRRAYVLAEEYAAPMMVVLLVLRWCWWWLWCGLSLLLLGVVNGSLHTAPRLSADHSHVHSRHSPDRIRPDRSYRGRWRWSAELERPPLREQHGRWEQQHGQRGKPWWQPCRCWHTMWPPGGWSSQSEHGQWVRRSSWWSVHARLQLAQHRRVPGRRHSPDRSHGWRRARWDRRWQRCTERTGRRSAGEREKERWVCALSLFPVCALSFWQVCRLSLWQVCRLSLSFALLTSLNMLVDLVALLGLAWLLLGWRVELVMLELAQHQAYLYEKPKLEKYSETATDNAPTTAAAAPATTAAAAATSAATRNANQKRERACSAPPCPALLRPVSDCWLRLRLRLRLCGCENSVTRSRSHSIAIDLDQSRAFIVISFPRKINGKTG